MAAVHTRSMTIPDSPGRCFALVTETYPPQINGVANTLGQLCSGLLARQHRVQLVRPALRDERPGSDSQCGLLERRVLSLQQSKRIL